MRKSNIATEQNPRSINGGKETEEDEVSYNLWVGNLSNDITDSDLMDIFASYGALDSVTTYATRNFAFIYFKHIGDARAAKDALQGSVVRGNRIKIEFARPAKPGKRLWVGAISSTVTKGQLEDEFLKFGKIEDFKFLRDRNSALIDYFRSEDAAAALKTLNGKRLGGEQIRVDFLRSQPSKRENWSDFHDLRDRHFNNKRHMVPPEPFWMPPDGMRNFLDLPQFGLVRHPQSQPLGGRRGEEQPSNVLWIGYPPSAQIDEQMLHNAMILFGEIEKIKSFPSRHYSFVEFRSVDEARRAKEGLQGRLFNDPRIQIMFSSSELAPGKDSQSFLPGIKGPRPDMFFGEPPFGPGSMDLFGHNRPMAANTFAGPNMLMRPFGPQGGFDPLPSGPAFTDSIGLLNNFPDANPNNLMGPNWRRLSSPAAGLLPSPVGIRPIRPMPGAWDELDANTFQRESKRSRMDGPSPADDLLFPTRKVENRGIAGDQPYGFGLQLDRNASGLLANVRSESPHGIIGARGPIGGHPGVGLADNDHCWRGVIAKGGTPVCHARCIPLGKGISSQLPEIVNCSARTGLDLLAKHYSEANGFEIVFFLPDSEDDFASYTEFLRYLGEKNRAGVAKFDDGTTLFLVPPSDFLTNVLNVPGPERLYGVVLKLPQQMPSGASIQQPQQPIAPLPQYIDRLQMHPTKSDYNLVPQKEEQFSQIDYDRVLHEDSMRYPSKPLLPSADESNSLQSIPQEYASNPASTPQVGVSLTPELIATLAALLPTSVQSSASTSTQFPLGSSAQRPSFPASVTPDKVVQTSGWKQDHQATITSTLQHSRDEQSGHPLQQLGNHFNSQTPLLSHFPGYANSSNGPDHSAQVVLGSTHVQDPPLNVLPQGAMSSGPLSNFVIPSQGPQYKVPQQTNQQFQLEAFHNPQRSYGMVHTTDSNGPLPSSVFQQPKPPVNFSPQVQGVNPSQPQLMPLVTDKMSAEFPNQVQQLQSVLSSAGQGTAEGEADKNQRYQSTLQFAASLLLQIQQQQQQANAQGGSNNHQ